MAFTRYWAQPVVLYTVDVGTLRVRHENGRLRMGRQPVAAVYLCRMYLQATSEPFTRDVKLNVIWPGAAVINVTGRGGASAVVPTTTFA
jgi:hypothetical protein